MLELYHWEPNTFYLKPLVALAEKGASYSGRYFDPTQFEQFAAGFPLDVESRLHLEREGPILVHDGTIVSSSYFLLEYIAEALPGPALLPEDAYDRYRARAWGQISALSLASAVTALGCARHLAPTLRRRPADAVRAQIEAIEPLERRAAWAAVLDGGGEAQLAGAQKQLIAPVARIEAALASSPWLAGTQYSIADIDVFAMLTGLPELAPNVVSLSSSPHIMAFLQRMHARPAVRAALALSRTGRPAEAYVPGSEPSRWG